MAKFGVGQPVRRVEDQRFITGQGRYTDDIDIAGQAYGVVVRSAEAHARIRALDVAAAKAAPGVLGVITGADIEASGGNLLPCAVPLANRDGSQGANRLRPVLCTDRVRHVGDHVAFVVAGTLAEAKDAAELVSVDYESLPVVADTEAATAPGQPLVHDDVPNNLSFDWQFGDPAAAEAAFAKAARTVKLKVINNRLVANAIEPRAAIAEWDAGTGVTLHACTQGGWLWTDILAGVLKVDGEQGPDPDARRRRRLRHEGVLLPRVRHGGLGRARARPAGQVDRRAQRDVPCRRHGPRPRHHRRARPRRPAQDPGHAGRDRGQHGRLQLAVRALHPDHGGAQGPARRLRRQEPGLPGQGRAHQHHAGRCLSRRRAAGVDLSDGAADGRRGARGRPRPGRVPQAQLHRPGRHAVQDRGRRDLRFRRVRQGHGRRAERRRLGRLRPAPGRGRKAWPAPRHRHLLLHRIDHGRSQGSRQNPVRGRRHGQRRGRDPVQRPGPRDRLRPGPERPPGHPVRKNQNRPGRHQPAQMGRRHRRLALADRRGHGDPGRVRHGDRARQALRLPGARDRDRRHRVRARGGRVPGDRHRPRASACSSSPPRRAP